MSADDLRELLQQGLAASNGGGGEEDLRSLLGALESMNAQSTPVKKGGSSETPMSVQKQIEQRQQQRQQQLQQQQQSQPQPPLPPPEEKLGRGANNKAASSSIFPAGSNVKFSSGSAFQRFNLMPGDDRMDSTVLSFHSEISLRTKLGRYLTATPTFGSGSSGSGGGNRRISGAAGDDGRRDSGMGIGGSVSGTSSSSSSSSSSSAVVAPYVLGVDGQGVGDPLDCLHFVSLDGPGREYKGPLRYGMTVALRVSAAKERYMGIRAAGATKALGNGANTDSASPEDTKPGFWRALPGSGERWTILQGKRGRGGVEEPQSRGRYVRQGDFILLMAGAAVSEGPSPNMPNYERVSRDLSSDDLQRRLVAGLASLTVPSHLLTLYEGVTGAEARLAHRDRAGLGGELFQIDYYGSQPMPYWASRPYLSNSFLLKGKGQADQSSNGNEGLRDLDPSVQQACVVREALLALTGVQGQLIKAGTHPPSSSSYSSSNDDIEPVLRDVCFRVDPNACSDRSLTAQVQQLLPVCDNAVVVRDFIRVHARQSYGLVSHALASSIKLIFREFDVLIAQLEHQLSLGQLSVQRLVYLLQPSGRVLKLLSQLALRVWDQRGGELLDSLHDMLLQQGDAKAKALMLHLFNKAMHPFLQMLKKWIFDGELHDSYSEFLIKVDRSMNRDALSDDFNAQYWESRYTLHDKNIPKVLRNVASRILTAGKYLSVVKGCIENGLNRRAAADSDDSSSLQHRQQQQQQPQVSEVVQLELPPTQELELDSEGSVNGITSIVETAYYYSSKALLKLLEEGHGMTAHLNSLSRFFLLAHGDFFVQFMDTAGAELERDVGDIAVHRMQSLLQAALGSSTLHDDSHRDALSCSLASTNLIQHLHLIQTAGGSDSMDSHGSGVNESTASSRSSSSSSSLAQGLKGVEALVLDYAVAWPMNLVLSRRAITKYQLLSRLLFFSKHVEARVLSTWSDHQATKELSVRESMGPAYCLRHRMVHFLHNFVYYISLEVVGPRGHEMRLGLESAVDMDEVLGLHERFLDSCLKECLLASQSLLANLTKIMTTCLLFADNMKTFSEQSSVTSKKGVEHTLAARHAASGSGGGKTGISKPPQTFSTVMNGRSIEVVEYRDVGADRRARLDTQSAYVKRESETVGFQRMIRKFESTFDAQLSDFMENLWQDSYRQHPQLANLCTRLDYNGFYSGGGGGVGGVSSSRNSTGAARSSGGGGSSSSAWGREDEE